MAHQNIPIRFRFMKIPVTWELSVNARVGPVASGRLENKKALEQVKLVELDAWQCRDEFFSIADNDAPGFTQFLNRVGVWSADPEAASLDWSRYPIYAHLDDVLRFREELTTALVHPKSFRANGSPALPRPQTLLDLIAQSNPVNSFPLRFELTDVAAGIVTLTNARQMLLATVLADVARGIRFKTCKRKDCQKPFAIESEHKRDYCGQYCGHLESVRRSRRQK